ncbi:MAG TPA: RluA family pseudouridine synthase [Candidatus Saccharibacteria bacterium]|nr:RluA family pseudouridine synthase [Candidatus Saccharibacteria bacterium]HMT39607.1 RluA family pseudouridine synthase [Candidatus Saccharibacteria bacterium]
MPKQVNKSFQLTVSDLSTSTRLDLFLSKKYNQYSRSQWSEHISAGKIKVNGKVVKPSARINNNDMITGDLPITANSNKLTSPEVTPEIIYKDKDVIVINKPAGLLSHALSNKNADSVAGAFKSEVDDDDPLRSGIVHRLDKQTSGIMILARNATAKKFLQEQFKARKVKKTYIALVHGHLQNDAARLELPITRSSNNPQKMIISKQGKPAISEYHTIKKYKDYTLISIKIMTGRTHQIRVQMAYIGNPVAGDMLYSNKKSLIGINRQFLHSSELTIELPSGTIKTFRAPLPDDLEDILKELA